jgi:hypothetical protein
MGKSIVELTKERSKNDKGTAYEVYAVENLTDQAGHVIRPSKYDREDWMQLFYRFHQLGFTADDLANILKDIFKTDNRIASVKATPTLNTLFPNFNEIFSLYNGTLTFFVGDQEYAYLSEVFGTAKTVQHEKERVADAVRLRLNSIYNGVVVAIVTGLLTVAVNCLHWCEDADIDSQAESPVSSVTITNPELKVAGKLELTNPELEVRLTKAEEATNPHASAANAPIASQGAPAKVSQTP